MTEKQKVDYFQKEIDLIQTEEIKKFLVIAVKNMFDYMFEKEASSSGKFHPMTDLGEGGLLRHVKGVFYIGYDLLSIEQFQNTFSQEERDIILVAILLHDSWKYDNPAVKERKHTTNLHPLLASTWVRNDNIFDNIVTDEVRESIAACIESHSGQWNTDKKGNELFSKPKNKMEEFVHMCDYIASRRYLNFDLAMVDTKIIEPIEPSDYVIPFGKHKNQTIEEIYMTAPDYLEWAENNMTIEPASSYICKFLRQVRNSKSITMEDIVDDINLTETEVEYIW